jgi:hypothetical protein
MLKYVKRRRVDEEKNSEKESNLSEPSKTKEEKQVAVKKFAFTTSYLATGRT